MIKRQLPTYVSIYLVVTGILSLGLFIPLNNMLIDILHAEPRAVVDKLVLSIITTLILIANIMFYTFILVLIIK